MSLTLLMKQEYLCIHFIVPLKKVTASGKAFKLLEPSTFWISLTAHRDEEATSGLCWNAGDRPGMVRGGKIWHEFSWVPAIFICKLELPFFFFFFCLTLLELVSRFQMIYLSLWFSLCVVYLRKPQLWTMVAVPLSWTMVMSTSKSHLPELKLLSLDLEQDLKHLVKSMHYR